MTLFEQVQDALENQENIISIKGYKGLTRAELEMVEFCVVTHAPLIYGSAVAMKLYNNIVGYTLKQGIHDE